MTVYGCITDYERSQFRSKFGQYYTLDPKGTDWYGLAEVLDTVKNRIEFRHSFGYARMVSMLRTWCIEAGLTKEFRGEYPHELEGYYGLERR
jgi:hypothetical protein